MNNTLSRSVKFARSLALASTLVLPACSGTADPTPAPETAPPAPAKAAETTPGPTEAAPDPSNTAAAGSSADDAGALADATGGDAGHISGPLPPPELPASFV